MVFRSLSTSISPCQSAATSKIVKRCCSRVYSCEQHYIKYADLYTFLKKNAFLHECARATDTMTRCSILSHEIHQARVVPLETSNDDDLKYSIAGYMVHFILHVTCHRMCTLKYNHASHSPVHRSGFA